MQYNLLFYGFYTDFCTPNNNNVSEKDEHLRTLLGHFKPDIFAVNEMGRGAENVSRLLDSVLNSSGIDYFEHGTYTNSTNSWFANALYFDSRKFGLYHEAVPSSTLRDINLYTLYYKAEDLHLTGDTIFLTFIVAHLKAGQSTTDQQTRTSMVNNVMHYLNTHNYSGNIFFMGDFNMKSSYEQAYQLMVGHSIPEIRFHDPIGVNGIWGNNPDMAPYHTQSPRTGSHSCFVTGGLDDRYDFILASNAIMNGLNGFQYIEDSYTTIGQDGNRFNQSLISPPNFSQPEEIISAVYNISDHLPVMLDLVSVETTFAHTQGFTDFEVVFPNPVKDILDMQIKSGFSGELSINMYCISGRKLLEKICWHAFSSNCRLDFSYLKAGVYLLNIDLPDGRSYAYRIMKM